MTIMVFQETGMSLEWKPEEKIIWEKLDSLESTNTVQYFTRVTENA